MSQNLSLKKLRTNNNYSIKELAKLVNISKFRLFLYENGYISIREKDILKLMSFFNVTKDYFDYGDGYPTFEKINDDNKENKKSFINKLLSSKILGISSFSILLLSIVSIVLGQYTIYNSRDNALNYFNDEYKISSEYVKKNGELSINPFMITDFISTTTYTSKDSKYFFKYKVSHNNYFLGKTELSTSYIDSINNVKYVYEYYGSDYFCNYQINNLKDEKIYQGYLIRDKKDSMTIKELIKYPIDDNSIVNFNDPLFKDVSKNIADTIFLADQSYELRNKETINISLSFYDVIKEITEGERSLKTYYEIGYNFSLFGGIIGATSLMLLCMYFVFFLFNRKRYKNNEISLEVTDPFLEFKDIETNKRKKLKKNIKFFPFIPESILRFSGLICLLIGSCGTMILIGSVLEIFPTIGIQAGYNFYKIAGNFLTVALFLLFFTKIDISRSNSKTYIQAILMFGFGLIFYIFEVMVLFDLNFNNNLYITLLTSFMPGNFFWGMAVFSLLNIFLFYTPKWCDNSRKRIILFRCLAIIPLSYLFVCAFYKYGRELLGLEEVHYAISSLFFNKSLIISLFAVFYSLGVYFYRLIVVKKYGKENALIYINGNKYLFIKNLIAVILIIILGLFDYFCKDLSFAKSFGLGKNYYILILVPFIMFYHIHFGKRSALLDKVYLILYQLFFGISYIFIFFLLIFIN